MAPTREYFKISTPYANYYAEIFHQNKGLDKVYVGARKKCVAFSVYTDIDEPPNLDGFGKGSHLQGVGSVHLLKCAMMFVTTYYKMLDARFRFTDSSYIECEDSTLPLPVFYIVFHNNTWYEKHFNATPLYIDNSTLDSQKSALQAFLKTKPDITGYFTNQPSLQGKILSVYKKHKTLLGALEALKQEDCNVFRSWLPKLVSSFIPNIIGTEWDIKPVEIDIKINRLLQKPSSLFSYQKGGIAFAVPYKDL